MIFETNEWKLEIIPRFVQKDLGTYNRKCFHCNGTGRAPEDPNEFYSIFQATDPCKWCNGAGTITEKLRPTTPQPQIDMDFIEYMRECVKKYKERT